MNEIETRLQEWARWVRVRQVQGHCLSIEYRYRRHSRPDDTPTGYGDWTETPPVVPEGPVNALQALEVERCMRWVPILHRKALKLHYVYHLKSRFICQRLAIRYKDWDIFLANAQSMVVNLLDAKSHHLTTVKKPETIQVTIRLPAYC